MSKLPLQIWSPLPPARSGIADYSASLIEALSPHAAVQAIGSQADASSAPSAVPRIYHVGNNSRFHGFLYDAVRSEPGILVLHDTSLFMLHEGLSADRGGPRWLLEELDYCDGPRAVDHLLATLRTPGARFDLNAIPMFRRLVESSQATIVHSAAARETVLARCPDARVFQIPMGTEIMAAGESSDAFIVAAFGRVAESKRIDRLLQAAARARATIPALRLVVCGPFECQEYERDIRSLADACGLSRHVTFTGDVPLGEFLRQIRSCDVVVNLRFPSAGETSATMMRAFGAGKPVIASKIQQFTEFDPFFCIAVPVGDDEVDQLTAEIIELARNRDRRELAGRAAQDWVRRHATWPMVAERYLDVVKQSARGTHHV